MKELINEAKSRAIEIAESSKLEQPGSYLAIYQSENGYTVSWIRKGSDTRTPMIAFGPRAITKEEVITIIEREEQFA